MLAAPIRTRLTGLTADTVSAGLGLALLTGVISGISVWLNAYGVKQVPDAAVYTTLKNLVAAFILIGAVVASGQAGAVHRIGRRRWPVVLAVAVIGGSVPFLLFFTGLAHATAPGAAFIQKTMFVWVALLAVPLLNERLGIGQLLAIGVLLIGQLMLAPPKLDGASWTQAETMIAAATVLWAVEVILVKRYLSDLPAAVTGALRLGLGAVILVGYLAFSGSLAGIASIGSQGWLWVAITGVMLAAYVGTWFAALRRAPASSVSCVLVIGAVITAVLQSISSGSGSLVPLVVGSLALLGGGAMVIGLTTRSGGSARERAIA
jgi:drug/metabolite transporter (DMT)-like permease